MVCGDICSTSDISCMVWGRSEMIVIMFRGYGSWVCSRSGSGESLAGGVRGGEIMPALLSGGNNASDLTSVL